MEQAAAAIGPYTLAVSLAGFLIDTFLFGVFTVQAIRYYAHSGRDVMWIKLLVAAVVILACFSTGYNWYMASHYFVYNFGRYIAFLDHRPYLWQAVIDCANISACQLLFTYRAYRLNNRVIWIPIVVLLCIVATIGGSIAVLAIPVRKPKDAKIVTTPAILFEAASMAADLVITVTMLYGLIKAKKGLAHTNKLISRVIRMTLESQVPATTAATVLLVSTIVMPSNQLGFSIIAFHSKIYTLGLFYSLNMRNGAAKTNSVTMNSSYPLEFTRTQAATIHIDQETEMHVMNVQPLPKGLNLNSSNEECKVGVGNVEGISYASSGTAYSPHSHGSKADRLESPA